MNPVSLTMQNYRSFREATVDFRDGITAITGENGAGKSSIVNAIELCLFGGRLASYVSEDATLMRLELTFDHGGRTYSLKRSYNASGRGASTVEFYELVDDEFGFTPLTRESAKATQAEIERVIGFTRPTWRASSFLAQGDGGAFTEADPRERKAVLAEAVLGRDPIWPKLLAAARGRLRNLEANTDELGGVLHRAMQELDTLGAVQLRLQEATNEEERWGREASTAYGQAETFRAQIDAMEDNRRAHQAILERALPVKEKLADMERQAVAAADALEQIPLVDEQIVEQSRLSEEAEHVKARRASYESDMAAARQASDRHAELKERAAQAGREAVALRDKIAEFATESHPTCVTCGQELRDRGARERTHAQLVDQLETQLQLASELSQAADKVTIPKLPEACPLLSPEQANAAGRLGELVEKKRQLTTAADVGPDFQMKLTQLRQERLQLEAEAEQIPPFDQAQWANVNEQWRIAKEGADRFAVEHRKHSENLAVVKAEHERLLALQDRTNQDRQQLLDLQAEAARYAVLERAYSQNGIPALLIENTAIPQIETEANRILSEIGGAAVGVQLHTQRDLKSGDGTADTLDVIVQTETGMRAYETFSGGERSRVNVALRVALAALLAARRGAESQLLVVDEPDGLDQQGFNALLAVLEQLTGTFRKILVVSHHPELRDSIEQSIELVKKDGVSQVRLDTETVYA